MDEKERDDRWEQFKRNDLPKECYADPDDTAWISGVMALIGGILLGCVIIDMFFL